MRDNLPMRPGFWPAGAVSGLITAGLWGLWARPVGSLGVVTGIPAALVAELAGGVGSPCPHGMPQGRDGGRAFGRDGRRRRLCGVTGGMPILTAAMAGMIGGTLGGAGKSAAAEGHGARAPGQPPPPDPSSLIRDDLLRPDRGVPVPPETAYRKRRPPRISRPKTRAGRCPPVPGAPDAHGNWWRTCRVACAMGAMTWRH